MEELPMCYQPLVFDGCRRICRCGLQIFLLVCSLLGSMSAAAFTETWNPFGYSVFSLFNYSFTTAPPLYASKQAVCEGYPSLIGEVTSNACYEASVGDYCVPKNRPCLAENGEPNAWTYSGATITPSPVCTYTNLTDSPPVINTRPPSHRNVRALVAWSSNESACICLGSDFRPRPNVVADLNTGWCYDPFSLDYIISTSRYTPSTAKTPVALTVIVRRSDGLAVNTAITLRVTTADGTPGTITPASGVTDANGEFTASYTFPQFDKKQVDVIEIGCDACMSTPALVNITMAPTVVGFFNGVWNTAADARNSQHRLEREFGTSHNGASLKYDLFYNQTGCGSGAAGKAACLQDVFEVFAQRDKELDGVLSNRWEMFWEILSGSHKQSNSLTGSLLSWLGGGGNALLQLIDSTFSAMINKLAALTGSLLSNPPTAYDIASQVAKLKAYADDDYTLLLVAHSQGNLFVNAAYDGLKAAKFDAVPKVVHVAPASPTLRGHYVLADIDVVINGLRLSGINSVQPVNIYLPTSSKDLSGHMFEGTYLDVTRTAYSRVKFFITDALESL